MSSIRIDVIPVTGYAQNCMLLRTAEGAGPAVLVDPGGDIDRVEQTIRDREAQVEAILVTHGHRDHIGGLPEAVAATGAGVWYHPEDRWLFEDPAMGVEAVPPVPVPADATELADGDVVEAAGLRFEVLHTPGHSPGHVSFLLRQPEGTILIGGDLIFAGSVGRTDLPRSDQETLVRSVRDKIWPLPDATYVLPGHGPATSVGQEKQTNPFVGLHVIGDTR